MRDRRYVAKYIGSEVKEVVFLTAVRKITYNKICVVDMLTNEYVSEIIMFPQSMELGQAWNHPIYTLARLLSDEDESYLNEVIQYCL